MADFVCPHCGYEFHNEDDLYLGEGCHLVECGRCDATLRVSVHVHMSFEVLGSDGEEEREGDADPA